MNGSIASLQLRSLTLINAYVRIIIKYNLPSTPKEILSIVSNYFLVGDSYLTLWNGGIHKTAGLYILNITQGTGHKLSIIDIHTTQETHFVSNKYAGHCIVSNVMPSWTWLQDTFKNKQTLQNNNISMIFRFGGRDTMWQTTDLCEMILYENIHSINNNKPIGYHIKLPTLNETISSASYIYNNAINDNIFCFGGDDENWNKMNTISYLNLQTLKWIEMKSKLCISKCFPCLCNYNKNNIFIIGGFDGEFAKNVEMLNVINDTIVSCKDMIYDSSSASCVIVRDKIYVVGGLSKQNKARQCIQVYDIKQNKWNILNKKSKYNNNMQYIFNNPLEPNVIYVADKFVSASNNEKSENAYIEWLDLRDNNGTFQLLYKTPNEQLFGLQNVKQLQRILFSNHCNLW